MLILKPQAYDRWVEKRGPGGSEGPWSERCYMTGFGAPRIVPKTSKDSVCVGSQAFSASEVRTGVKLSPLATPPQPWSFF